MRFPVTAQGSRFALASITIFYTCRREHRFQLPQQFERREEASGSACQNPSALHLAFNSAVAALDELGRRATTPSGNRSVGWTGRVVLQQGSDLGPVGAAEARASVPAWSRLIAPVIASRDPV
jgi:hypothetical protein